MNSHTTSGPSDTELFERIKSRDQSALSDLYDRHSRLLYSIIAAIVRDTDEAEDLLQEVFVRIWTTAGDCRSELGTPKTWMVRMAHNQAIDRLRSRRNSHVESASPAAGASRAEPAVDQRKSDMAPSRTSEHPIAALSALPIEERAVIDLAFLQGYTHDEIAEITGIPAGSVRSTIRSGMMTLRSRLGIAHDTGVGQSS